MATLTRDALKDRLKKGALVVSPILSEKQIGETSIDVRLGNQFLAFRSHRIRAFEPLGRSSSEEPRKVQERLVVREGETLTLHPGVLVLGCTLEYVSMPSDIECQVEGRSSWARVGLQIATASSVEPGYKGVITLELSNVGTVPLKIMPGIRIAQLVFHEALPQLQAAYAGKRKYKCAVGPEFSKVFSEPDWKVFSGRQD